MIDELNEMERANLIRPEALDSLVPVDRDTLIEMLEADSGRRVFGRSLPRSATRAGYVGALVAAAAAVVAVMSLRTDGSPELPPVEVEVADERTPATALVVEDDPAEDAQQDDLQNEQQDGDASVPSTAVTTPDASDGGEQETLDQPDGSVPESQPEQDATPDGEPGTETDAGQGSEPEVRPTADGPFDRAIDLVVLHFDHAHMDDGHAAVAAWEIADTLNLSTHVVSGTHSADHQGFVHDFEPVMRAAWGDRWLNANADRSNAVQRSADRWLDVIDAGGRVWVAEGGVADFTADVLREVTSRRPGLDTVQAVRVVQHAGGNEEKSQAANLAFVKDNTSYERIDDGNATNGTANLNQRSDAFASAALAGRNAQGWTAAFDHLPAAELDFSDTVEVLHIVGVDVAEVADPDDFAARFLR